MPSTTLVTQGLDDAEHRRLLLNAVQDLPGIDHVVVDAEHGEISIEHGRLLSAEDIIQALREAGFIVDE